MEPTTAQLLDLRPSPARCWEPWCDKPARHRCWTCWEHAFNELHFRGHQWILSQEDA